MYETFTTTIKPFFQLFGMALQILIHRAFDDVLAFTNIYFGIFFQHASLEPIANLISIFHLFHPCLESVSVVFTSPLAISLIISNVEIK